MDEAYDHNVRRARRLVTTTVAVPTLIVAIVLGVLLGGLVGPAFGVLGLLMGLGLGVQWYLVATRAPASISLAATGARPAEESAEPRLHNLVDGLCVAIGLPKPGLWVVEDPGVNALAVARSIDSAAVVVTRGVLDDLTRVEQEAVLAHELARVRRGDAVVGSVATVCLGGTAALATPPGGLAKGRPPGGLGPGPAPSAPYGIAPLLWAAPLVRALTRDDPSDEGWTDLAAVEITRFPPGLEAALVKAQAAGDGIVAAAAPSVAHLWLVGPEATGSFGAALRRVYDVRRPLADRIEMLQEL